MSWVNRSHESEGYSKVKAGLGGTVRRLQMTSADVNKSSKFHIASETHRSKTGSESNLFIFKYLRKSGRYSNVLQKVIDAL